MRRRSKAGRHRNHVTSQWEICSRKYGYSLRPRILIIWCKQSQACFKRLMSRTNFRSLLWEGLQCRTLQPKRRVWSKCDNYMAGHKKCEKWAETERTNEQTDGRRRFETTAKSWKNSLLLHYYHRRRHFEIYNWKCNNPAKPRRHFDIPPDSLPSFAWGKLAVPFSYSLLTSSFLHSPPFASDPITLCGRSGSRHPFLKHESSILRQSSNPVCGFSMI